MSSHREAPETSKDPMVDTTDLYAFVSPDRPDTVTLIVNYLPCQVPSGGPDFCGFGDDVLYEIHIDNDGDGHADITYQFRFRTETANENTFLDTIGPIDAPGSDNGNRRQLYSVTRVEASGKARVLACEVPCPPCDIGPLSTLNYVALAQSATVQLNSGEWVFAGQRAKGLRAHHDAIVDPGDPRPWRQLYVSGRYILAGPDEAVSETDRMNVHSIAMQIPIAHLVRGGNRRQADDQRSVIGVWTSAGRQQVRVLRGAQSSDVYVGPITQVSRFGNPLFNECIVATSQKDLWTSSPPADDKRFVGFVEQPELAALLTVRYPDLFPNLAALNASRQARMDLVAMLLTGFPTGLIDGFQNNTGDVQADMLRLNTAIPPARRPSRLGLLDGDLAGFPNGRRVTDDAATIVLRAIAGLTLPLIAKDFIPDDTAGAVTHAPGAVDVTAPFLKHFPYLGVPYRGSNNP